MRTTISHASQFRDAFKSAGRADNFSYDAFELLFDYFEDIDPDMELDVIAICCDYSEDTPEDIAALRASDSSAAHEWRLRMREQMLDAFGRGMTMQGITETGTYVFTEGAA
jgi:hypothetical protein